MARKFKPGDWVKVKGKLTAPKMQVLKYITKNYVIFGEVISNNCLECVWYQNGKRKLKVFHQNKLIKLKDNGAFFKDFLTDTRLNLT
ncbi:hypothetical protein [Tenacibaculum aestuariivivum]|uniref:hypothetical protein n=1 Tax=Tenacibaculum aestuariivivum TaxID=2006131 RepID=UPI003AB4DF25